MQPSRDQSDNRRLRGGSWLLSAAGWLGVLAPWVAMGAAAPPAGIPLEAFQAPPGLEVTLWASSPLLHNPANIDIDRYGRIWVAEAVNYRGFQSHQSQSYWREQGDRIVILEDTDQDGTADRSTVFVQDKDLVAPLGIAVMGQRVLVSCSPALILYTDLNENGVFDPGTDRREVFLTGFGGFDHDHGLHSVVAGPDGQWWFNAGNAGPHVVTDKSGWTLRAGSGYTGGTPYNTKNTPGLKSDDGRVYVGGLAMRVRPDGTGLFVHSHNFRNSYELALDSFGNVFQSDNDDQVKACRTTWLMEHANAGYASADGQRAWQADRRPGQSVPDAHWHQDDPGVVPLGYLDGAGSPTGILVYEGDLLGPSYRGVILSCEAGRNVVWGYRLRPRGAGFDLDRFSFLASVAQDNPDYQWSRREKDPRQWFRPSDVAAGPDGAIYVADWFDPVVGGHQMDDRNARGAIYRVAPAEATGRRPPIPSFDLTTTEGQLLALQSPAANVRFLGFERLLQQGDRAVPALLPWLELPNEILRARAIWLLAQLGTAGRASVLALLRHPEAGLRLVAFRALRTAGQPLLDQARELSKDNDPAVRREVALAMRDVPLEACEDILLHLAERWDGLDRWYLEALGIGCEGKENALYPTLLGRLGSLPGQWDDRFAGLVWRLHPRHALDPLSGRAADASLSYDRRKQALDTLAFIQDKQAALAMAELTEKGPEDLREEAAWWLHFRGQNDWRPYGLSLGPALKASVETGIKLPPKPAYLSPVLRKGDIADVAVDISGASHLYLVVTDGGDDIGCDWADWIEPRLMDAAGKATDLTTLKWSQATSGWGHVYINKNTYGLPLRVNGREVSFGIGTHANSVIVYALERSSWTRLVARAGLDNGRADLGGTDHPPGRPSVVFQVYHDGPLPEERVGLLQRVLLNATTATAEREQAALDLAETKEGASRLFALAAQHKIPEQFQSAIGERIHRNPDLMVRALASQYFPLPENEEAALPPLPELVRMDGHADQGKELFFGRAACATCHQAGGEGGKIGPDLSHVGTKFDRLALLDAIINPSAAITFGFEATLLTLKDGDTLTGFVVGAGDPLLIVDIATGEQRSILSENIQTKELMKTSVMPPARSLGLQAAQVADLAAFLSTLRPPTP